MAFRLNFTQQSPFDLSPIQKYILRFGKENNNQFFKTEIEEEKKYKPTSIRDAILSHEKLDLNEESNDLKCKKLYLLKKNVLVEKI